MRLDVVSLVPEAFEPLRQLGVIGRAFSAGIAELHCHNPRDYATDRYRKVDDEPSQPPKPRSSNPDSPADARTIIRLVVVVDRLHLRSAKVGHTSGTTL